MRVSEGPEEIRAIDESRRATILRMDWSGSERTPNVRSDEISYDPDFRRRYRTTSITTDPVAVTVVDPDTGSRSHVRRDEQLAFDQDTVLILRLPVLTYINPESSGLVRHESETEIVFSSLTEISVGFETRDSVGERGTVTVPRTARGVAAAIEHLSTTPRTISPDRSWPNVRPTPPEVELDENSSVPDVRTEGDSLIVVPDSEPLRWLFPTATLAYYVEADVQIESDRHSAVLRAGGETFELGSTPEDADRRASEFLRRIFYFDCHVRAEGDHGEELSTHRVLADHDLSADQLYDAPMGERVRQYLSSTSETPSEIPEWPLGVHISPVFGNVDSLAHHLDRLADLYLPSGETLDTVGERIKWGDEARLRGSRPEPEGADAPTVIAPEERARYVGWQAPGRALGAYNWVDAPDPFPLLDEELSVAVVHNSAQMDATPVEKYRNTDRMSVTFVGDATTAETRSVFESEHDLVHYIGHHDEGEGLRCSDGNLNRFEIDECTAQAFFLNACGSYRFGERLVECGAAAGVATTRPVPDDLASRVGTDWSRLIALGWTVERAVDVCRRVSEPGAYLCLGDGSHVVTESDALVPPEVREYDDGSVEITHAGPRWIGGRRVDVLTDQPHLQSVTREYRPDEHERDEAFSHLESPTITESGLDWP